MVDPSHYYRGKIDECSARLKSTKRRAAYTSAFRLADFAVCILFFYEYFSRAPGRTSMLLAASLALVLFVVLVKLSASLSERKRLLTKMLFVNENELATLESNANAFANGESVPSQAIHAMDLDVFGEGSLFHQLNRTTTTHGHNALATQLNYPLTDGRHIAAQQEAVKQFAAQPEIRQLITANGLLLEKDNSDISGIESWIQTPELISANKFIRVSRILFPVVAIAGIFLYLDNSNLLLLGIGVAGNWLTIGYFGKYISQQHSLIGKKEPVLRQYGQILNLFSTADAGESSLLLELRSIADNARHQILKVSRLSSFFDQRLNLLVATVLNSFLQYDIYIMMALEKWKKDNNRFFVQWIAAVGDVEKLNSLATFYFNRPSYHFPEILEGKPFISAKNLGHPLIPAAQQVTNDIDAGRDGQLLLITGSNMSGKSTFLRTIGINTLLAQCGLPVCATAFSFTPMHMLTSIRISDSLQENTSYFMAELKRLKQIIGALEQGHPSLVLIDEVLRGTNSDDKTYGSIQLIKKLSAYNCLAFFATHDLSLNVLEFTPGSGVRNYCFESTISDGDLLFDYKLRRGVATNKNASFLMNKMGII